MENEKSDREGVVVMEHRHRAELGGEWGFEFTVRKNPNPTNGAEHGYEASAPFRKDSIYAGYTPEEAVGALMQGLALLSRDGALNPDVPYEKGTAPVQHAIDVLSERLRWQVDRRRDHLRNVEPPCERCNGSGRMIRERTGHGVSYEHVCDRCDNAGEKALALVARDNEVISALATSIAALARVKDF